jgi:hypothetical protein
MGAARSMILVSLLVVGGVGLACDESTTSFQGPFGFLMVALAGDTPETLIPEGGTVTISEGEQLRLKVQAVDSRDRPIPEQIRTACISANADAVLKLDEALDGSFMLFLFSARARGNSVLTCQNDLAGITRIVLVRVEGP